MDLKDIRSVIELMRKNSISEFELEQNDFKIRMKRGEMVQPGTVPQPMYLPAPASAALHAPAISQHAAEHDSPAPANLMNWKSSLQ